MGGRSTSLQLLKVLDKWTSILDEGGVLNAVYMDCIKAFDKVPHTRLLVKMKAYGLSEKMCTWVQDFLSDRKQTLHLSGWNLSSHVSLHLNNSLRSDCMILASLSSFISLKIVMSSAKRNTSDFTHSGRSRQMQSFASAQ
jgi:hypothetical protein